MNRRWDIDERGHGVADARQFADGARELVAAMETTDWVAEEPEAHLLPHIRRICEGSPLSLVQADVAEDGVLVVELRWQGGDESHWPEVWRSSEALRSRRPTSIIGRRTARTSSVS